MGGLVVGLGGRGRFCEGGGECAVGLVGRMGDLQERGCVVIWAL